MKWFKENWFKITVIIIAGAFITLYAWDVKRKSEPSTLKELVEQELLRRFKK